MARRKRFQRRLGLPPGYPVGYPIGWGSGSGPREAVLFTPADLSALFAWYDPSDSTTITQSLGKVSQLNDKSGNGRHLAEATGSQQPGTGIRTIGGRNALDFDGSNDVLQNNSFAFDFPSSASATIWMVIDPDAASDEFYLYIGDISDSDRFFLEIEDSTNYKVLVGGDAAVTAKEFTVTDSTVPTLVTVVINGPAETAEFFLNGVSQGTLDYSPEPTLAAIDTIKIGNRETEAIGFNGGIGEVVLSLTTTAAERAALDAGLLAKWNLL